MPKTKKIAKEHAAWCRYPETLAGIRIPAALAASLRADAASAGVSVSDLVRATLSAAHVKSATHIDAQSATQPSHCTAETA